METSHKPQQPPSDLQKIADAFFDLLAPEFLKNERILLRHIARRTQQLFGTGEASIFLVTGSPTDEVITYKAGSSSVTSGRLSGLQLRRGEGIVGWVIEQGQAKLVADVQATGLSADEPVFSPVADDKSRYQTRSLACAPLIVHQQVVGALEIVDRTPHQFSAADLELLKTAAYFAAILIQQFRHLQATRRRAQLLDARARVIGQTVPNFDDLDYLLEKMVDSMRLNFDFYYVGLYLVDEKQDGEGHRWARLTVASGQHSHRVRAMLAEKRRLRVGSATMIGWTIAHGQPRISLHGSDDQITLRHIDPPRLEPARPKAEILEDSRFLPGTRSSIALPLMAYGEMMGAISIQSETAAYFAEENFSNEDVGTLQALVDQLAFVIYNARLHQQTKAERRFLEIIRDIDRKIITTTDQNLTEHLQLILDQGVALIDAEFGQIFLYNDRTEILAERVATTETLHKTLKLGQSVCGRVVLAQQSIRIDDLSVSAYRDSYQPPLADRESRSELAVPLIVEQRVIGVFNAESERVGAFDRHHQEAIEALATQAAMAIQSARLFERATHRASLLKAASEVSRNVIALRDLDELLHKTVEMIVEKFGFYYAGIFLVDDKKTWAVLQAGSGQAGRKMLAEGHRLRVGGDSMIGQATGPLRQARVAFDVGQERKHFKNPHLPATRSEMALPLYVKSGKTYEVIGALSVQSVEEAAFSDEDIEMLQAMADQLAVAINDARLHQEVERHTRHIEVLRKIDQRIISPDESQADILDFILTQSCRLTGAESGQIFLIEADDLRVVSATQAADLGDTISIGVGTIIGDALFRDWALIDDLAMLLADESPTNDETGLDYSRAYKKEMRSRVAVSIFEEEGTVLGVLSVEHPQPHRFTSEQVDILAILAGQIAITLKNRTLMEQEARRVRHSEATAQVGADIISILNVEQLLAKTVDLIHEKFELYYAGIFLIETVSERQRSWPVAKLKAASGEGGRKLLATGHQLEVGGNSMVGYTTGSGQARIALDVAAETVRFQHPHLSEARSEMALPLRNRTGIIGALDVQSRQKGAFSRADVQTLQMMADQLATAIYNAQLYERTEEDRRHLAALRDIDQAIISAELNLEQTLKLIVEKGLALTQAKHGSVLLLENDKSHLRVVMSNRAEEQGLRLPVSDSIPGLAVEKRQTIRIAEVSLEPRYQRFYNFYGPQTASVLLVPLQESGMVSGVFSISTEFSNVREYEPLSERQQATLETLAEHAAIAIKNAALFEAEQKRAKHNEFLRTVAQHVSSTLEMDEILDTILGELKAVVDYDGASIQLMRDEALEIVKYQGYLERELVSGKRFPRYSDTPNAEIIETQQSLLLSETEGTYPGFESPTSRDINCWLGVPLLFKGKLLGIITVDSRQPHHFSREQVALTEAFALQVAGALANARLFERHKRTTRKLLEVETVKSMAEATGQSLHWVANQTAPILYWVQKLRRVADPFLADPDIEATVREDVQTGLEIIEENARLVLQAKEGIMGAARPFELTTVTVAEVVQAVLKNLDFHNEGMQVTTHLPPGLPPVRVDRLALAEVLRNLFLNARQATQASDAPCLRITGRSLKEGRRVQIGVADNGLGIPADRIKEIWTPFYTTYAGAGGTGVGLSYCLQAIHKMGGQISVESEVGRGTTFWLEIPTG